MRFDPNTAGRERIKRIGEAKAPAKKVTDPNAPRPAIACEKPIHDFGELWTGPVLHHTFTLKNKGKGMLEITRVKPSCGCTIAGKYPRSIPPGKTGEFPFSVASTRLKGKFEKAITIHSNDPVNPTFRIRLRGHVKKYIDVVPPNVHFGKVLGESRVERVIKLTNNTDDPLELKMVSKPPLGMEYKLETREKGKSYDLKIAMIPPFKTGIFRRNITIETNVKDQTKITIDVRGNVPERLEVTPRILSVSPARGVPGSTQKGLTRIIRLSNYGEKPVKLLEATCDDQAITLKVQEQRAGKNYTVQVNFPAGYEVPEKGLSITLRTDDTEKPLIKVPVRGARKKAKRADAKGKRRRPAELMVGKPVPSFALTTTEGKSIASADLKGKVTVLDFFAPNCGFCKKQIPRLEKVRKKYEAKGVRFVAISQTMRKKYSDDQVIDTLKKTGFNGELAIDSGNTVGPLFKATSYPTMVVIGKSAKVDAVNVGNIGDLESRLGAQLDALLAGKPVPTTFPKVVRKDTPKKPAKPRPKRKLANDLIGKPAPSFSFKTLDGKTITNADLAKHPATVFNFVATNCGYCKKQIPRLEKIRKNYQEKGVRFVNVVQTMRKPYTQEQVVDVMKSLGSHLELAHDPSNTIGSMFGASGFPTMIVLGKSGKVEAVNIGNLGDLEKRLATQFDALIAGKPVPKTAQAPAKPRQQRKRPGDLIGKPAPSFAFETLDGKKITNADLSKHPATILNVVAANCGYCKKQIPRLEKVRQKYAEKGVRFVNVVQTMRKKYETSEVVKIIEATGSKLELAHDPDNKIGPLFNASGFPTMIVLGKSGKIEAVNVGNIGDLEKRLGAQLDALIAGKPIPKTALAKPKRSRPAEGMVGKAAPKFALTTLGGKSISNADFTSHPATVLNFVAPNCGFCKRQLPNVEKIRKAYEAKGVRFVNVSQTMRKEFSPEEAAEVFKSVGAGLELAMDKGNKVGRSFQATSYPTMMVVDKNGKIAHVNIGAKAGLDKLLSGQLDKLISGS